MSLTTDLLPDPKSNIVENEHDDPCESDKSKYERDPSLMDKVHVPEWKMKDVTRSHRIGQFTWRWCSACAKGCIKNAPVHVHSLSRQKGAQRSVACSFGFDK